MTPKITVGEFSSTDFVTINTNTSSDEALEKFASSDFNGKPSIYYVFVEENNRLKGVASVKDLMNSENVEDAIETDYVSFKPEANLEKAARAMAEHDFQAFPVVKNGRIVGVIRMDEVLEFLEGEETDDIFKMAGFLNSEEVYRSEKMLNASVLNEVKARLPWLLFALIGGLVAGSVIETYQYALETTIILAFFIPVIMDMGGNVGTQSSTILVRGLTLDQIHDKNYHRFLAREGFAGLIIGIIMGLLGGLVAYIGYGSATVGYVILISMALTCFTASIVGYAIPMIAEKMGLDPAAVSDPLVTTVKDITALLIYFSVAAALLGL